MTTLEPYRKDRIGAHLSYPVKFGELVSLLSPAVEQLDVRVWFCASYAPRQNESREEHVLMEAQFSTRRPESGWWLLVKAVPRSSREAVRSVLIPAGTDRLRDWLLARRLQPAKRPPRWHTRSPSLRIRFIPSKEVLEYETA